MSLPQAIPTHWRFQDLTGQTFGRWHVKQLGEKRDRRHFWICECECPKKTIKSISAISLKAGTSQSCGCIKAEQNKTLWGKYYADKPILEVTGEQIEEIRRLFSVTGEIKPIPWALSYAASDGGRIFCARETHVNGDRIREIIPHKVDGYLAVNIFSDGEWTPSQVHVIVARIFLPPPLPGHEVRHLDGSRDNSHFTNLVWGTRKENMEDMVRHGRSRIGQHQPPGCMPVGEDHHGSKFTNEQIREIRKLSEQGLSYAEISRMFGVTIGTIRYIVLRRTWKHIV